MSSALCLSSAELGLLHAAPFAAATYVSLASGGLTDYVKEMTAAARFFCDPAAAAAYGELVAALLPGLLRLDRTTPAAWEHQYHSGDPPALRAAARTAVGAAAALLCRFPPPAADGYRHWLMQGARTAAVANTRTFLPAPGGPAVDPHEEAAIADLALLLLTPP